MRRYIDMLKGIHGFRNDFCTKEKGGLEVEVICNGSSLGRIALEALQPYETAWLTFDSALLPADDKASYEVVFSCKGKEVERNTF